MSRALENAEVFDRGVHEVWVSSNGGENLTGGVGIACCLVLKGVDTAVRVVLRIGEPGFRDQSRDGSERIGQSVTRFTELSVIDAFEIEIDDQDMRGKITSGVGVRRAIDN